LKKKEIFSFLGGFLLWETALFMKIEQFMEKEGNFVTLDHDFICFCHSIQRSMNETESK